MLNTTNEVTNHKFEFILGMGIIYSLVALYPLLASYSASKSKYLLWASRITSQQIRLLEILSQVTRQNLLILRHIAADFMMMDIRNGMSTLFWSDKWLPVGRLIDIAGDLGPARLGIPRFSTVSEAASRTAGDLIVAATRTCSI